MNILILAAELPFPPASGGSLRLYGLIHGLRAAGHTLTLLCFADQPPTDDSPLTAIARVMTVPTPQRSVRDRLRQLLLTRQPDIATRFYSAAYETRLADLLATETFDLAQAEGIEMGLYLPIVRRLKPAIKLCFDEFNAEYALQRRIFAIDARNPRRWAAAAYSGLQVGRICRYERALCRLADAVIAVSDEDADLLRGFRDDRQVFVVPNGIFVADYDARVNVSSLGLAEPAIVFTGTMDYRPNLDAMLWFGADIYPKILAQSPTAHLYIVGQRPHPRLDVLRSQPGVVITGRVDTTQPYLRAATVYVAPLRMGSGTRLKLLEAMASGCAIVATPAAAAGLQTGADRAMIIVENAATFSGAVIDLLNDPTRRDELRAHARRYAEQHYDWAVLLPRLLQAYKDTGIG
jgi:glycosyltransferase involved in cell wall biosynthesis